MSLSSAVLFSKLSDLFIPGSMPSGDTRNVVASWMQRYAFYAKDAMAGSLPISIPFIPNIVLSSTFLDSLDTSLRASWQSVIWTGPGQVGNVIFIPSLTALMTAQQTNFLSITEHSEAAQLAANVLHAYTIGIIVSISAPPAAPFTITLL